MSEDNRSPHLGSSEAYERTRELLGECGFAEEDLIPYTGDVFGSWIVTVAGAPRLRVVWEGKDGWAVIQAELLGRPRPRGYPKWEDVWIGKQPEDLVPEEVVKALERIRDLVTEARRLASLDS